MSRLVGRGLVEGESLGSRKLWRISAAGRAAIEGSIRMAEQRPGPGREPNPRPAPTGSLERLRLVLAAYATGDLGTVAETLSPDVILFVPGMSVLAGTYGGRGRVLAMLRDAGYLADVAVEQSVVTEGEARIRVVARTAAFGPEREEIRLWVRGRFRDDGRVAQVVIQPDDQEAFDRAVGKAWRSDAEPRSAWGSPQEDG